MRKLRPSIQRGIEAESRFITLARSLRSPDFVRSVRKASPTLDKHGIDVIIFVHSAQGKKDIKVPVQVKSSVAGIYAFQRKHQRCVEAGVISMVVNEGASNEKVVTELQRKLLYIQQTNKSFTDFFLELRHLEKGPNYKQVKFSKQYREYVRETGGL